MNALEYLKAYALNAKTENKPIFPDGARVWISTNGYSKAVEADDVVIDGSNITIGGIVWNGSAWDFTNAGQTGGGGSGSSGVLVVHEHATVDENNTTYTLDKTWLEIVDAELAIEVVEYDNSKKTYIISDVKLTAPYYIVVGRTEYQTDSASGYPSVTIGRK